MGRLPPEEAINDQGPGGGHPGGEGEGGGGRPPPPATQETFKGDRRAGSRPTEANATEQHSPPRGKEFYKGDGRRPAGKG